MDSRYKHKIGQEVANSAPTPVTPTDDSKEVVNVEYLHGKLVDAGGTSNTSAGAFNGVFDVSGGNKYYDDYTSGSALGEFSLSSTKVLGATATVRIAGDLIGSIPSDWNLSGQSLSTSAEKLNELTLLYVAEGDIRIVNRIVNNTSYVEPDYLATWEDPVMVTASNGSITDPTGVSGWSGWAEVSDALNGNGCIYMNMSSRSAIGLSKLGIVRRSDDNRLADTEQIDFFVGGYDFPDIGIQEFGVHQQSSTVDAAKPLELRITNGVFTIEQEGTVFYTSPTALDLPLTPVGLLFGGEFGSITDATFEGESETTISPV